MIRTERVTRLLLGTQQVTDYLGRRGHHDQHFRFRAITRGGPRRRPRGLARRRTGRRGGRVGRAPAPVAPGPPRRRAAPRELTERPPPPEAGQTRPRPELIAVRAGA